MAILTQTAQNWYKNSVQQQASAASRYTVSAVKARSEFQEDIAKLATDTATKAADYYSKNAGVLSNSLFNYVMELEGYDIKAKVQSGLVDKKFIKDYIESIAEEYYTGEEETFFEHLSDMMENIIHRAANWNTEKNCDINKVKYARIVNSRNPCAFCIMLSGRGFVYATAESAGKNKDFHANCRCIVIPSMGGDLNVIGWQEKKYYDYYREARELAEDELYKLYGDDMHKHVKAEDMRTLVLSIMRKINGFK